MWRTLKVPSPSDFEGFTKAVRSGERSRLATFPAVEDAGYDAERESLWLVREWRYGESLPSALGGLHPVGLDLPLLQAIAEQLAEALTTAHSLGLVHGRLRPSRLFVTQTPRGVRLSVLDLGVESFRSAGAHAWLQAPRVGTAYLAPELEHASTLPASADVFAFGLIVRDMLATRKDGAWRGRWERWVERATARNPSERFGGLAETLQALRPVVKGLPDPLPAPPDNFEPVEPVTLPRE